MTVAELIEVLGRMADMESQVQIIFLGDALSVADCHQNEHNIVHIHVEESEAEEILNK